MDTMTRRHCQWAAITLSALAAFDALGAGTVAGCADDPIFQQQNFALGHWQVFDAGKPIATVTLEKLLKGCVIQETWTSSNADEPNGTGLFTYSRLLKSWGYFWVADNGQATSFTGSLAAEHKMLYVTEAPQPTGRKKLRHWTLDLQADGSIQELSVGTLDGTTWSPEYELIWRHKP